MADKKYNISVILKAVDKMSKPITTASMKLKAISTRLNAFSTGINRFTNRAFLFTGLATGAMTAFIMKTATAGDTLAKTATMLDMSAAQLYRYQFAARRSGLSTEELNRSLMFFTRNIGDALQGTGEAKRAFEVLGIQLHDDKGRIKTNTVLFKELADRIAATSDQNIRLSALQLLFGRSGARMFNMLKDGSKGLEEYERRLKAIGGDLEGVPMERFEDFKDMVEDIGTSTRSLSYLLIAEFASSISRFMDRIALKIGENRDVIIKTIGGIVIKFKAFIGGIWDGIQGVYTFVSALLGGLLPARRALDKSTDSVEKFRTAGKLLVGLFAGLKALQIASMFIGITAAVTSLTAALMANPLVAGLIAIAIVTLRKPVGELISDINRLGWSWEYVFTKIDIAIDKLLDKHTKLKNLIRHYTPIGLISEPELLRMPKEEERRRIGELMQRRTESSLQDMRRKEEDRLLKIWIETEKGLRARAEYVPGIGFMSPDMGISGAGR